MQNCLRLACGLMVSSIVLFAQPPGTPPGNGRAITPGADQAWLDLQALKQPAPKSMVRGGRDASPAETTAKIKQQVQQLQQLAVAARDFRMQNPDHAKAGEARKIEIIAMLQSIDGTNAGQEQSVLAQATAYRADKTIPGVDRFDVALFQERYNLSLRIRSKAVKDQPQEWTKLGDALLKEFGDLPALQAYYLEIARRADDLTALQIATQVARSPASAVTVRAEAQSITGRATMVGKPLVLKLPKLRGGELILADSKKVTVLVVWSPSDPGALSPLKAFPDGLPAGVQLIYFGVGKVSHILAQQEFMPLPGVHCYSPTGPSGKALSNALQLQYAPAPFVYVLDKAGKLAAYGRVKDLPAMLAKVLG
jgi:hypothetical protein